MKISYYFPPSPNLASYRYRMAIPGMELQRLGHTCEHSANGEVVVFAKHFNGEDLQVAENCKGKVVFDWCDDHRNRDVADHYRAMAEIADAITCPTETMAKIIKEDTGKDATVISDPYEYPDAPVKRPGPNLFWFGHQSNLHTLKGLKLNGYNLHICTGADWSYENMLKGFAATDIVIIPTNEEKQYKSPNRMIESIRQGHVTIAGPMPSYEGYWQWLGDIAEGVDWALNDPMTAMKYVEEGKKVIEKFHSPKIIGEQWERLFQSL